MKSVLCVPYARQRLTPFFKQWHLSRPNSHSSGWWQMFRNELKKLYSEKKALRPCSICNGDITNGNVERILALLKIVLGVSVIDLESEVFNHATVQRPTYLRHTSTMTWSSSTFTVDVTDFHHRASLTMASSPTLVIHERYTVNELRVHDNMPHLFLRTAHICAGIWLDHTAEELPCAESGMAKMRQQAKH